MWLSPEFQPRLRKANLKPMSAEVQKILDIEDNIPPTYEELETIFKQEWSKLKRESGRTRVRPFLLRKSTMMVESESNSSIQMKCKPGKSC